MSPARPPEGARTAGAAEGISAPPARPPEGARTAGAASPSAGAAAGHPTWRICLVENHADTAELLAMLLTQRGHQVLSAANCAQARHLLQTQRFDVLLSDIGLPDGSGWELLEQLTDAERPHYAIAMSGFGALSDRERSRLAGFRHHLVKPIDLRQLVGLLNEAGAPEPGQG
jgi:CheY-like chemotaxis protein